MPSKPIGRSVAWSPSIATPAPTSIFVFGCTYNHDGRAKTNPSGENFTPNEREPFFGKPVMAVIGAIVSRAFASSAPFGTRSS